MGIMDPVTLEYYEKRDTWILSQGRETFYSEQRELLEWVDPENAVVWLENNRPDLVELFVWPDGLEKYVKKTTFGIIDDEPEEPEQESLF